MIRGPAVLSLLLSAATGCAPTLAQHRERALPAIQTLQAGAFDEAEQEVARILEEEGTNPYTLLVDAVARYRKVLHNLWVDGRTTAASAMTGELNQRFMRYSLTQADQELIRVQGDLAEVARYPELTLDLCPACWERDWNHDGEIDDGDRRLLQIELDRNGEKIPEGDPRRKPTFRFDHGDILWASAFVGFQRAAINLLLAYDWSGLTRLVRGRNRGTLRFKLTRPEHVATAQQLILDALDLSDRARIAYLAETDDEREWLPNPRQVNHPLPLPVDEALYETWEGLVQDLRLLARGETGLSVGEVAQLGDHKWERPPAGFIDVGRMLTEPGDVVVNIEQIDDPEEDRVEGLLRSLFGDCYVAAMTPSQLPARLSRMKSEVDRGEESFERKLRYLLWVN